MPTYLVPITRDTTETTYVDVVADNPRHAVSLALDEATGAPENFDWTLDEGNVTSDPYFAGGDDYEAVDAVDG